MSDTSTDEDTNNDEGGIAGLRESARKGAHALAENADLKRQLLFTKVGIDLDTKLGKMLFRTFEGDDAEALKAEAIEIHLLKALDNTPSAEELAAQAARTEEDARRTNAQQATSGGRAAGAANEGQGENPRHLALEGFQQDVRSGVDREEAATDAMAKVIAAASRGDQRMFFDQAAHQAAGEAADRAAMTGRRS